MNSEGQETWQQVINIISYPYGWQYPAITEQHAYERICEAFPDVPHIVYIGFPWATVIDFLQTGQHDKAQPYIDALKKIPSNNASIKITVAQHIYTARYIELFESIGITDLFWSHTSIGADSINGIRLHPFPLYPVRCLDEADQTIKSLRSRKYLYSFVGAYDPQHYISPVRHWLSKLPQANDSLVRVSKEWHFQSAVYDTQILDNAVTQEKLAQLEKDAKEYGSLLKDTVFSLCPSGSGPNSIRLWESLGFGCIPVIIADTLKLPGEMSEWQEAAVFVREEEELILKLPVMLRDMVNDFEKLQKNVEAGSKLFEKYGHNNFIYDILQFSESVFRDRFNTALLSVHIHPPCSNKILHAMPKITIVTPSFNQADYLEECIDSILSQNYPNLEYIIMDGGSTDGSVEIIKKYEKHLTYWQSKPDGGQYAAIHEGFRRSTGEIMAWLNSDDKLHPGSLWLVSEIFKNPDIEWIMGTPTIWDQAGALHSVVYPAPHWSRENYLRGEIGPPHIQQESTFWRRKLWEKAGGKIDCTFKLAADMELWSRFFRHSQLYTVDAMLGGFRLQPSQKTAQHMDCYNNEAANVIEREQRIFLSAQDKTLLAAPPMIYLADVASQDGARPTPGNFGFFTYSRTTHFPFFAELDRELYGTPIDPKTCDLKAYQDLLVLSFIRHNIPAGSRVLEIGGGDSRVLRVLNKTYECWNLDKLEGIGNGPVKVNSDNFRLVRDYIGTFCCEIPSDYFDFVFSISVLEHIENKEDTFRNILKDINRVLKSGGLTLHCFDVVARNNNVWTNPFLPFIFKHVSTLNRFVPLQQVFIDPQAYAMSQLAYESMWQSITNKTYHEFGYPMSYNALWSKEKLLVNGHKMSKRPKEQQSDEVSKTKVSPLFSIIIPTYNSASVINNSVNSIIKQTLNDFEIIIVDNLSTDNTIEILKSYDDDRIKVFSQVDKGIYDAMNKGIKLASGKWLYFMGSDDTLFDSSVLDSISYCLKGNNFYYGNVRVNGDASWAPDGAIYDGEFSLQKLLLKNICHQSIFYNKDVILTNCIEYKLEYPVCADWDFNLKCWSISPFTYVPITIATFNAGGLSTKKITDRFSDNLLYHLKDYFKIDSTIVLSKLLPKEKLHLLTNHNVNEVHSLVRLIAFHLPQFHTIPENDGWWGKGFTEWTNVTKAQPLFDGHYQPHVPSDLGYYDLSTPETLKTQAALASEYGIYGFCFYHYWFNGKLLLETPLHQMLKSGEPEFPFCLCWANEDWTRAWDGRSGDVLIGQNYNNADDIRHFYYLLNFFEDKRYIRINNKPLFLVYRANKMPNPLRSTTIWREEARKLGLELYLCRVESFHDERTDPSAFGFDASVEFQPDWAELDKVEQLDLSSISGDRVYRYTDVVQQMLSKQSPSYKRFPCIFPSWDNSPRRKAEAVIMHDSSPQAYKNWLQESVKKVRNSRADERIVFVNAWNEWGEGNHLEPDARYGRAFLEATRSVVLGEAEPENDRAGFLPLFAASIIIPVFNKVEFTRKCIHSIIKNTAGINFEVIIIDNNSEDGTKAYLASLSGDVKVITNDKNVGYTIACNQGAQIASGKHLVFLNNDTEPQPGWLEQLIMLAESDASIGAVGAKLVYPNGLLQEAGGMVFRDGRGWNFGNGDNPDKVVYSRIYEVDYCSGACLLVKHDLFKNIGGFDEQYAPAYYEETDLCFALRKKGYKTLYNPNALVIHHESVTAGLDLQAGYRKYIEINRVKFETKWNYALKKHEVHPSVSGKHPITADRSMRIK